MLASVITRSIPSPDLSTLLLRGNGRQFQRTRAKKLENPGEASKMDGPISSFRVSKTFLAKSAVAVFGLGFLDAGYSGDWSRIGVISKESEELLKSREEY
ncbi:uncharacterized protein [Typha angustifolia]|uniref:uncharacterized protein n=1 Tax=Typha angustifolia TaxID=59011 RepID=UPI003C2F0F1F